MEKLYLEVSKVDETAVPLTRADLLRLTYLQNIVKEGVSPQQLFINSLFIRYLLANLIQPSKSATTAPSRAPDLSHRAPGHYVTRRGRIRLEIIHYRSERDERSIQRVLHPETSRFIRNRRRDVPPRTMG